MIFKLPHCGYLGKRKVDKNYMLEVNARVKRMEQIDRPRQEVPDNQLKLPFKGTK